MERAARERREEPSERSELRRYVRPVLFTIALAVAATLLVLMLRQVGRVLLAGFAGVLLAIFLRRLAAALAKRTPLGPRASLAIVVVAILILIGTGGWFLAPSITADAQSLTETIPRAFQDLRDRVRGLPFGDRMASALSGSWENVLTQAATMAKNLIMHVVTFVAFALVIAAIGLYIAYSPRLHWEGVIRLMPPRNRPRTAEILLELRDILSWWIVGRIFSLFLVGALTTTGLWLLGVPSAVALGVLAGVLSFIPNFGPVLSVIPAILVALTKSTQLALYTGLLYAGVQFVESGFITPIVQRKAVRVPPALILFAQVLLGVIFGVLGLLLATPITVTAMVLVERLYVEDFLGESADGRVRTFVPNAGERAAGVSS